MITTQVDGDPYIKPNVVGDFLFVVSIIVEVAITCSIMIKFVLDSESIICFIKFKIVFDRLLCIY